MLPIDERVAGIELGGTKVIATLADLGEPVDQVVVPTTSPSETLDRLVSILSRWHDEAELQAIGIGSFGPIRVDPDAVDYGRLLNTPKPGWRGTDIIGTIAAHFACPLKLDTDVNAAGLAEALLGAGRQCRTIIYLTIGTGVGGGVIVDGKPVRGLLHPEIGHLRLRRPLDDGFRGVCPFHGDCIEGLISGPALAARFGMDPASCAADSPAWDPFVSDLAELFATLLLTLSPQRILVGGGVATGQPHVLPKAIAETAKRLSPYLPDLDQAQLSNVIALPELHAQAGPLGTVLLAAMALEH